MTTPTREAIMIALFSHIANAMMVSPQFTNNNNTATNGADVTSGKPLVFINRRLMTWEKVPQKPGLCFSENGNMYAYQSETFQKVSLTVLMFIYLSSGTDPNAVPSIDLNGILDALDVALAPDTPEEKFTLGGLVSHCYIFGEIVKAPGDLDGQGIAVVPLQILLP